jgi:hypothetical protein
MRGGLANIYSNAFAPSGALAREEAMPRYQESWLSHSEDQDDWRAQPSHGALRVRMDAHQYAMLMQHLATQEHTGTHGAMEALDRDGYGINVEFEYESLRQAKKEVISAGGLAAQDGRRAYRRF